MNHLRNKDYTTQETIIQTAKSTPVLRLLFLRNEISSTNDYKTRNIEKYCKEKGQKRPK